MDFDIEVSRQRRSDAEVAAIRADPGFAAHPTDHIVTARWRDGQWSDFAVQPYRDIVLDPRAMALHYGQAIFEGLKAFAIDDGAIATFRPESNAQRFALSAERMAMPPLPVEAFIAACDELVRIDARWVPDAPGTSLYLRPFMFASEGHIGIRAALEYHFMVLALPAAPFFSSSFKTISVAVLDDYVRTASGGTGEAKCAGNYAASLLPRRMATEMGCNEVLWLDASEHRRVEELSGMNVCFVEQGRAGTTIVTPRLGGTILRGVTRDSLLQLASELGYGVEERDITIDELELRTASGELTEAFALGTAAVVAPIGRIVRPTGPNGDKTEIVFGNGDAGDVARELYAELVAVQVGTSSHFPQWRHVVEGASVTSKNDV